jgi:hypothetical protein
MQKAHLCEAILLVNRGISKSRRSVKQHTIVCCLEQH